MTAVIEPAIDEAPLVPVPRCAEMWSAAIGMVASLVLLGGFSLVMNTFDEESFAASGLGDLLGLADGVSSRAAYELAATLGAWFGVTLVVVLLLAVAGILATRQRPQRRRHGWWFAAAGLACLLGSQLILYPVAFAFFVSAGLFAVRPLQDRSAS